ncbi:hypothetical protein COCNU_05G007640 [Cocos nucifera]|uniref:Uncharacterized protein n=1 Tax=Cocos nucifera TaxID=13894 RepID=A0A8K0N1Q3_COCNU|nr:hypothetical protein COCNU_05G007640 [Cocos nucifera]
MRELMSKPILGWKASAGEISLLIDWLLAIDYLKVCVHITNMPRAYMIDDFECARVNNKYAHIKGKPFPAFDNIDILFSKNMTTSRHGDTSALPEEVENKSKAMMSIMAWSKVMMSIRSKVNKMYAHIKGKPFPTFDDIDILFSKNMATGRHGDTSALSEEVSNNDTSDDEADQIDLKDLNLSDGQPSQSSGRVSMSSSGPFEPSE